MNYSNAYTKAQRDLGLRITRMRKEKGLSQRQLALKLKFDRVTLSQIESGKGNPTLETLVRIAEGLGKSVEELFQKD